MSGYGILAYRNTASYVCFRVTSRRPRQPSSDAILHATFCNRLLSCRRHGYRSLEGTFLGGCLLSGRNAGQAAAKAVG